MREASRGGANYRQANVYGPIMDYNTYRHAYFANPAPEQRFELEGVLGVTLYFADFQVAVEFYTKVLGPPTYVEGSATRGWRLGGTWLTLLAGGEGAPASVEVPIVASTPAEAERLQRAFIEAGASGQHPSDELMYVPVRVCPVKDPFGTKILIYAKRAS